MQARLTICFKTGFFIFLLLVVAGGIGSAQNPPREAPTGNAGGGGPSLDSVVEGPVLARGQDLNTILQLIQASTGLQIVLDEGISKKVTFNLESPTVRKIFETVLPSSGLGYAVLDNGVIRIATQEVITQITSAEIELMRRTFIPNYVDVLQLQDALTGLKSPQGQIIIDSDSQKIIVTDIPDAIEMMDELIQQLDVAQDIRVFDIQFADAQEIADQLVGVINTQEGELFVDYRNNRLIIRDTPDRLDQAQMIIEQLDVEVDFILIPLAFALPEDVLPLVEGLLTENGYVDYDPRTSRLYAEDIPSVLKRIMRLVQQLDIPTQQVWVETDIVQINSDKALSLGVSAAYGSDIGEGGTASAPDVGSGTDSGFFSFNPFLTTSGEGLTLMDVRKGSYRVQIDAMVEKKLATVIASPRLLIEDGQIGSFILGSEEPFATRQQGYYGYGGYGSGGGGDYFTQRSRSVGTSIELEVYASEAGYVEMYINMEDTRSRRVNIANLGDALAVDGSFINTAVTVKTGRTVVLGGIITRSSNKSESGVPILSSIPLLGNLFKSKSKSDNRQKMLIFITPRIVNIDDPFDFAQIDNFQRVRDLKESGVEKFVETSVDKKFLDWSEESENEQEAIEEALQERKSSSRNGNGNRRMMNGSKKRSIRVPSSSDNESKTSDTPVQEGIIRQYNEN